MTYGEFLNELAISLKVNRNTLHQVFFELLQSEDQTFRHQSISKPKYHPLNS